MISTQIKYVLSVVAAAMLPTSAAASSPLNPDVISTISKALENCTGSLPRAGTSLTLLSKPAAEISFEEGGDLYGIALALLLPAIAAPSWVLDNSSSLKCPAQPKEAVALMEYLAGNGPRQLRSPTNVFDWLGLAYQQGVGVLPDRKRARLYFLYSRMISPFSRTEGWSDGIDDRLLPNIERAGLRSDLEQMAAGGIGTEQARLILAEEALPSRPTKARQLLAFNSIFTLARLVELEDQGRFPVPTDGSDLPFWLEAQRKYPRSGILIARLLKAATLTNGGTLPVASERPERATLLGLLDHASVADGAATKAPIPMRALVNPQGKAIYIEGCWRTSVISAPSFGAGTVLRNAVRLYNLERLPPFPVQTIGGKPAFGWVRLPAVHFQRNTQDDQLKIDLVELPIENCVFSLMIPSPPAPGPPARPANR